MRSFAIGVGCRKGADAQAIVDLVRRALAHCHVEARDAAMFTISGKETERALYEAATALGLPLAFLPRDTLAARGDETVTKSQRVVDLFGVPSVAETAALAGAGEGARLVVPRMASDGATCAVARARDARS